MEKLEIAMNKFLSKLWDSKNIFLHEISDLIFNAISCIYKIIYYPSHSKFMNAIETYGSEQDKKNVKSCLRKMRHVWLRYGILPNDYFVYDFPHLTKKERKTYMSDIDRDKYSAILNDREDKKMFDHKYQTYQKYKKYYKREIIKSQAINEAFIARHPRFFFKPENSLLGLGTQIITASDYPDIQSLKDSVPEWNHGLCEELIVQDPFMSAFHPESINTVRMQTMTTLHGDVIIFGAVLKMGRGKGIIDNIGAGGIVADINIKTGIVDSNGADNWRHSYSKHPDTGTVIKGAVIPEWEEVCQMTKEIAKLSPTIRYLSLDMALTKDGWMMVEGNTQGCFLRQICNKRGYKKSFEALARK